MTSLRWSRYKMSKRQYRCLGLAVLSSIMCFSVYHWATSDRHWYEHSLISLVHGNPDQSLLNGIKQSQEDPIWSPIVTDVTLDNSRLKKRFPGCIVIGAKKAGTRALGEYLKMHPDIEVAFEPQFFSNNSNYRRGLEYYRSLMPFTLPHQITIEKSPPYFHMEPSERRIHKFNKTIKLIVLLRHPIKRLISDYWHERGIFLSKNASHFIELKHNRIATFEETVVNENTGKVNIDSGLVKVSMYYMQLKRWSKYFRREQFHFVDGENLIVNPIEEIEKIERFLGLEHKVTKDMVYFDPNKGYYCMIRANMRTCLSEGKGHTHPDIDPKVYEKLDRFFKDENEKLYTLLGQRFSWS